MKSFAKIKEDLEKEGYNVVYKVLKCSDYGIPQMRKRLFIVGFKNVEVTNLENFFKKSVASSISASTYFSIYKYIILRILLFFLNVLMLHLLIF